MPPRVFGPLGPKTLRGQKQYQVPFITRVKRQKDRETEKKTANVQMSRTAGAV